MSNKHPKSELVTTFSDPGVFESDDPIADAEQVYGDWPWIEDPCAASPNGHHEFSALIDPERCIHCRKKT